MPHNQFMKINRQIACGILTLTVLFSSTNSSNAAAIPGGPCPRKGQTVIEGSMKYLCIAAPRSIGNPFGKKLIWDNGTRIRLESLRNSAEIISFLNSIGFGNWSAKSSDGYMGKLFVSNYPCYLYMSPNLQDMLDFWNYRVNTMFYKGAWLAIENQKWIVNDVSNDESCIEFFAYNYGGRIKHQG